jgi:hypothetical protein
MAADDGTELDVSFGQTHGKKLLNAFSVLTPRSVSRTRLGARGAPSCSTACSTPTG